MGGAGAAPRAATPVLRALVVALDAADPAVALDEAWRAGTTADDDDPAARTWFRLAAGRVLPTAHVEQLLVAVERDDMAAARALLSPHRRASRPPGGAIRLG
jgi:hypothetical protein